MKASARLVLSVFVMVAAILLAACGPRAAATRPVAATEDSYNYNTYEESMPAATAAPLMDAVVPQVAVPGEKSASERAGANAAPDTNGVTANDSNTTLPDVPQQQETGRMIIKNADVKLQVTSTDRAIDGVTQMVGDVRGYIISSRVWYQDYSGSNYKYATITIGVPVDEFEAAMNRLRKMAVRVLDENASGQDVTAEFVDVKSQLGNLEATRDRIRTFLDEAKTVEESLRINQELSNIEAQIDQVKGRMNYLSGRSSFSTITINLEPDLPVLTPTPTFTPSPTPTRRPTATPTVWSPGTTVDAARETVTSAYQSIIEILIGFFIVVVPLLAPPAFIVWAIWKFFSRKKKTASGG